MFLFNKKTSLLCVASSITNMASGTKNINKFFKKMTEKITKEVDALDRMFPKERF